MRGTYLFKYHIFVGNAEIKVQFCKTYNIMSKCRHFTPFSRKFEAKVHVLLLEPFCMLNSAFMFKYFFEVKVKELIDVLVFFFLLILRYVQIYCKMNVAWWKFGSGSGGKMAHFGGALNQTSTSTASG